MLPDGRKKYVISCAAQFYGVSPGPEEYYDDEILGNFLDSHEYKTLCIGCQENKLLFVGGFDTKTFNGSLNCRILLMIKTGSNPINEENIRDTFLLLSVSETFLLSLYYAVQYVYLPTISKGDICENKPHLVVLLKELKDELGSALFLNSNQMNEISAVDKEIIYWKNLEGSPKNNLNERKKYELLNSLQTLSNHLMILQSQSDPDIEESLENIMNILDDLWKRDFEYPKEKIINLLESISYEFVKSSQIKLKKYKEWYKMNEDITTNLINTISFLEKWNETTKKLTFLFWPHYAPRKWTGDGFIPKFSNSFSQQLKDVAHIRKLLFQLNALFMGQSKKVDIYNLILPFEGVNYLQYSEYSEPAWMSAKEAFNDLISDLSPDILEALRFLFQIYGSNMTALIMEWSKFDLLLQLPLVFNSLSPERQRFLGEIQDKVSSTYPSFNEAPDSVTSHLEIRQLISLITDARINQQKLEIYIVFTNDTFYDLRGYDEIVADMNELKLKLKELEDKQFKSWTEQALIALEANEFRLTTSDPVVHFQSEKLLQVNFSDKLLNLINDTRKLTAYGFIVDRRILDAASKAKQFVEQAKILFQVANFHNTMSERIITSQSPMILNSARELARLVQSEHSVTFDNCREVNDYIRKLQAAVENLANENVTLVNYHGTVMKKVESLVQSSVSESIMQNDLWGRTMAEIRSIVDEVEERFSETNAWRRHIDFQICKALDIRYRWYLSTMKDHLPEMHIMLVYRNDRVEYSPSLCVIKRHYILNIKELINKIVDIRGVGVEKLFPFIKEKNSEKLAGVIRLVNSFFSKLNYYSSTWNDWLAVGRINIDSFFKANTNMPNQDWTNNFRAAKFFGQQVAKLPSSCVIGPFCVSLVPLKISLEWLNRNLWNSLNDGLKLSICEDQGMVSSFAATVNEISEAQNADEFINFRTKYLSLENEMENVDVVAQRMIQKNVLLRSWTRQEVSSVEEVTTALVQSKSKLRNYSALLHQQDEVFRVKIKAEAQQLCNTLKVLFSKWSNELPLEDSLKQPLTLDEFKAVMNIVRERNEQWRELNNEVISSNAGFVALGIDSPNFEEYLLPLRNALQYNEEWYLLEEFYDGLNKLGQDKWVNISLQAHKLTLIHFEDWKIKLASMQPSPFVQRLLDDIKCYEALDKLAQEANVATRKVAFQLYCSATPVFIISTSIIVKYTAFFRACGECLTEFYELDMSGLDTEAELWYNVRKEKKYDSEKLKDLDLVDVIKEEFLPHLQFLIGDVLADEHWFSILQTINIPKTKDKLLYSDLMDRKEVIIERADELKAIHTQASSEISVIQALSELDAWEVDAKFSAYDHINHKGGKVLLVKDAKGVLNKIGDFQCMLQSIKNSSGLSKFSDRVNIWESRLNTLDTCIKNMIEVQRKWAYLEPIFSSFKMEGIKFDRINKEWGYILAELAKTNFRVITLSRVPSIHSNLLSLNQSLAQCQRALQNFLEEKRLHFPRFYFLNDDDLLEILGQSDKPHIIQSHLKKIFAGVHQVQLVEQEKGSVIRAIYSVNGESVNLMKPVRVTSSAEDWLGELLDEIKSTLMALVLNCLMHPDPLKYPAQILCLAERINFTKFCEDAITTSRLRQYQSALEAQHSAYSKQLLELKGNKNETQSVLQLKLKDLLMDTIHHLNIIHVLIEKGVRSPNDWYWKKNLRFYCDSTGKVTVQMVHAEFNYSYEYQGNIPKLVYTSLTEKCYLTLTLATSLGFGGNPYGPAGTGKTESVKALGSIMGRQVLVFNCDEGLDADSLIRIILGVIKSGAWGCFDEFNRLDQNTLSLISLQISIIQRAMRNNESVVTLLGKEVVLDNNSAIFITLNPAGNGYGGRQILPQNLKQLFRPVLMSTPDDIEITQVILHCEGFTKASEIGQKIVSLFRQARCLLSHQQHYDFGLRAIKTVIGSCGESLRTFLSSHENVSSVDEFKVAVDAIRLNTRCKLSELDATRFDELITNIFPDVSFESAGREEMMLNIKEAYIDLKLTYNAMQSRKCLELFEQMQQRTGVVVVGPQRSGKTTITMLLKRALERMCVNVRHDIFNPKSMPRHHLLGQVDHDTREWTDGLLTSLASSVYNEPLDNQCWIHADGDVDPEWIESLNSVLDDNKLLTLPSGWRIQFGDNVNFIFETDSLKFASPATISRMGIILLNEGDLDEGLCLTQFLNCQSGETLLGTVMKDFLLFAMDELQKAGFYNESKRSAPGLLMTILPLFEGVRSKNHFAAILMWIIGSEINPEGEIGILRNSCLRNLYKHMIGEDPPADVDKICFSVLDDSITFSLYDYQEADDGTILTPYLKSLKELLLVCIMKSRPFILVSPAGAGKDVLLNHALSELSDVDVVLIDCSAFLQPYHILHKLNQVCITITRNSQRILLPKQHTKVIVHLSDIDAVNEDQYGTRMLVEFMKQAIERKGYHDEDLEWVQFENITFVFSVQSLTTLPGRFIDLLNVVYVKSPTLQEQTDIVKLWGNNRFQCSDAKPLLGALCKLVEKLNTDDDEDHRSNIPSFDGGLRKLNVLINNISRHDLSDRSSMAGAFVSETVRVLQNSIEDETSRTKFENCIVGALKSGFGREYVNLLHEDSYYVPSLSRSLGGVDKKRHSSNSNNKMTLVKLGKDEWRTEVSRACLELGTAIPENIILVPDFLKLVANLEYIMMQPGGSVIFPSKPGYGKKTALQIVSQRMKANILTLKMSTDYSEVNFQNELKTLIQMAGIMGENVIFLLEDFQIIEDSYLNMISCLLSHGEVFGLYSQEELESISLQLKSSMTNNECTIRFLRKRVKANLHLALIYEHDNTAFLKVLYGNPSLSKLCYTICCSNFSQETIHAIPEEIFKKEKGYITQLSQEDVSTSIAKIHREVTETIPNMCPISLFWNVQTYMAFLNQSFDEYTNRRRRLQLGVEKICEAQSLVDELKKDAKDQKVMLDERQARGKIVLDEISETMTKANLRKNEMEVLKKDAVMKNATLGARKLEIDKELESITPLVEAAQQAVGNIKPESLSEIRSLRVPPKIIRDILEGVLCLMGILDTSWSSMKSFLAGRGIRDEIRFFDARRITEENRNSVLKFLQTNKDSFEIKNAKRASVAAAPLAAWVQANVKYSIVLEKIRPLNEELAELEQNLEDAGKHIENVENGLSTVNDVVKKLKDQLSISTKEAAEIEVRLANAEKTILAAEGLISKLDDEFTVWNRQLNELSKVTDDLPLNCIIKASFVTYLAGTDSTIRTQVMNRWNDHFGTKDISLEQLLMPDQKKLRWQSEGLSGDMYSLQNAAILLHTMMPLLVLDPAAIALNWLSNHFQSANVESLSIKSSKFVNALELAIKFGKVLLLQDVDDIPPLLIPILRKDLVYQGPRRMIFVGNKLVDYDSKFKLFLITRSLSIRQRSAIPGFIMIINFSPTVDGLRKQLLSITLAVEKPDLEKRRLELLHEEEELKNKLFLLQEKVLQELADSQGDILQNEELLKSLKSTKESSVAIRKSLDEAVSLKESMAEELNVYNKFADHGTRIYFACTSLSNINKMYYLSVRKYVSLFEKTLAKEKKTATIQEKSMNMLLSIYNSVSQSLFKDDRLTFALQLIHSVFAETFNEGEWDFFIDKTKHSDLSPAQVEEGIPKWISEELQNSADIVRLKVMCPALYANLRLENETEWKRFLHQKNSRLPDHCGLTPFQYILVLKGLRPDMLHNELVDYCLKKLGLASLSPEVLKLEKLLQDVEASSPILIITSPGTDPSEELRSLANTWNVSSMKEMVLAPGLEELTIGTVKEAAYTGNWVLLKNLQLVVHWLPILESEIQSIMSSCNQNFRLWMVTESHVNFPETLLSVSTTISYEAPPGLKNNLIRTYNSLENLRFINATSGNDRTMYLLAWFHAAVQERRSYIPQGWTSFYEFNDIDILVAGKVLNRISSVENDWNIQQKFITELFEHAIYGGRVNNIFDLRVLSAYLKTFFGLERFKKNGTPIFSNIFLPDSGNIQDHLHAINSLSDATKPEYLELPPNIEIIRHRVVIGRLIKQLKEIEKKVLHKEITIQHMGEQVKKLFKHWATLKQRNSMEITEKSALKHCSSLNSFFFLEAEFTVTLMKNLDKEILQLYDSIIIRGALPKKKLINSAIAISHWEVPENWSKMWNGPQSLDLWLDSVINKSMAVHQFCETQTDGFLDTVDLSNMFHCGNFFMALKQDAASEYNVPLDQLHLVCSWDKERSVSKRGSILLKGLVIEGATIINGSLEMTYSESPSISEIPSLLVSWEVKAGDLEELLFLPLYSNEFRSEVIVELQVPCKPFEKTKWIKAGTAFYILE